MDSWGNGQRSLDEELAGEVERGLARGAFDCARIEDLLSAGASPEATLWGEGLLHALADGQACAPGAAARLLLAAGADPSRRGVDGAQPLGRAAASGNAEMAMELWVGGADPKEGAEGGGDPMAGALEREDWDLAVALLEAGYPAHACRDSAGSPALVRIAGSSSAAALAFELIFRGADPDGCDGEGWTPLSVACRAGCAPIASLLVREGASPGLAGPCGLTPLALALGARQGRMPAGGAKVSPGHMACALRLGKELPAGWGSAPDARGLPPLARLYWSCARFELEWM